MRENKQLHTLTYLPNVLILNLVGFLSYPDIQFFLRTSQNNLKVVTHFKTRPEYKELITGRDDDVYLLRIALEEIESFEAKYKSKMQLLKKVSGGLSCIGLVSAIAGIIQYTTLSSRWDRLYSQWPLIKIGIDNITTTCGDYFPTFNCSFTDMAKCVRDICVLAITNSTQDDSTQPCQDGRDDLYSLSCHGDLLSKLGLTEMLTGFAICSFLAWYYIGLSLCEYRCSDQSKFKETSDFLFPIYQRFSSTEIDKTDFEIIPLSKIKKSFLNDLRVFKPEADTSPEISVSISEPEADVSLSRPFLS